MTFNVSRVCLLVDHAKSTSPKQRSLSTTPVETYRPQTPISASALIKELYPRELTSLSPSMMCTTKHPCCGMSRKISIGLLSAQCFIVDPKTFPF